MDVSGGDCAWHQREQAVAVAIDGLAVRGEGEGRMDVSSGEETVPGSREREQAVAVATWLEGHHSGMESGMAHPTARLGHPGDVFFGPLIPISFIPLLRDGPIGPSGP